MISFFEEFVGLMTFFCDIMENGNEMLDWIVRVKFV